MLLNPKALANEGTLFKKTIRRNLSVPDELEIHYILLFLDHNLHIRTVQARIALDFSRLGIRALEGVKAAILELLYTN